MQGQQGEARSRGGPPTSLTIEEVFDRAMSLPSSPLVKEAPSQVFSSPQEEPKKQRSASEKSKKEERREKTGVGQTSSSGGKRSFLEGFKRRTRSRSGENMYPGERGAEGAREVLGRQEVGRQEVGRQEVGRQEVGRQEVGRQEVGRQEVGRKEVGRQEVGRQELGPCGLLTAGSTASVHIDYR